MDKQDQSGKNYKIMMKEIKQLNERRDVPQSGIGGLHIVNIVILLKPTYRFNQFPSPQNYLVK